MKPFTALTLTFAIHGKANAVEQAGLRRRRLKSAKSSKGEKARLRVPASPPLPGVSNNDPSKPKVVLAVETTYPPYTSVGADLEVTGFGPEFARGLDEVCHIDVFVAQTDWDNCWGNNKIGQGLLNGYWHGCSTYTNVKGVRNRYLEFSAPILDMNKPVGLLARLENGSPVVDGRSSLNGVKVGDVVGWAPTQDVLAISRNLCTQEIYSGFTIVEAENITPGKENDAALTQLLDGEVDVLWIYADQASLYKSACDTNAAQAWDCSMWSKFGTEFAYIQTGSYDYMNTGTTLAMSKLGSGLGETLNPCIEAFIKTESYYKLCKKYDLDGHCFRNKFFGAPSNEEEEDYYKPTNELTTSCSDGYCPCP